MHRIIYGRDGAGADEIETDGGYLSLDAARAGCDDELAAEYGGAMICEDDPAQGYTEGIPNGRVLEIIA